MIPCRPVRRGRATRAGAGVALVVAALVARPAQGRAAPPPLETNAGAAPVDVGTSTATPDSNPADTNPADTNPADTNPVDTNPADTNPADTNPADTNPADTNIANTRPADTGPASNASWRPPPDPLLSDAAVPEWPSTAANDTSSDRTTRLDAPRDPAADARARGWVRAGVVGMVTGSGLIGGAIAMRLSDPCAFGAGNNCFEDARNRAAALMGVPGGIMLAGGVAMLIVGKTQQAALTTVPMVSRRGMGLLVTGRF